MYKTKTYDIAMISVFTALISVCSWITVPVPAIPFTMQIFGIFLALEVLGGKNGTVSVILYVLLGAVGLPVFAGFNAGLGALAGVTGGYILGFIPASLTYWLAKSLFKTDTFFTSFVSMLLSLFVCYAFGTLWFYILYTHNTGAISIFGVLMSCVIPYIIPDIVKILLAVRVASVLKKHSRP